MLYSPSVNTVASGGSSRLFFRNGLFVVGPESASAHPGPTCYRKGGPLAITDANLVTGRLATDMFPQIFGPNENEGLDMDASLRAFEALTAQINAETQRSLTVDEVAHGFLRVANEAMCRPIRSLTQARGFSTSKHVLACFGGAGGQHACAIARALGITTVVVHKYSSILSAYGMALADRVFEAQEPSSETWGAPMALDRLEARARDLEQRAVDELVRQGFPTNRIHVDVYLNMRYDGTDTALMTLKPAAKDDWDMKRVFVETYRQEFGFILKDRPILVDDVRVRATGRTFDTLGPSVLREHAAQCAQHGAQAFPEAPAYANAPRRPVYFDQLGRQPTAIVRLRDVEPMHHVPGPAILIDETQTILIEPRCEARMLTDAVLIQIQY